VLKWDAAVSSKGMLKYGRVYTGKVGGAAGRLAAAGVGFALAEDRATAGKIYHENDSGDTSDYIDDDDNFSSTLQQ